jgi:hypothetical protein
MKTSAFVGTDDACGRREFRVSNIEEPRHPHHRSDDNDDRSESPVPSEAMSARADAGAIVGDDRLHASGNSDLRTQALRERAVQEIWGISCLSRFRRSVRILC